VIIIAILTGIFQGIIRGIGIMPRAWFASVIGYYMVGIPVSIVLMNVYDMGLEGIWIGLFSGITMNTICYVYIIATCSFQKQTEIVLSRNKKDSKVPAAKEEETSHGTQVDKKANKVE
jgi:MATE family multidrug resistance protein